MMTREEALNKIREMKLSPGKDAELIIALHTLIPELVESKDERIRKELIGYLKECRNNTRSEVMIGTYAKWIAYLEKQKEPFNDEQAKREFKKGHYAGRLEGYQEGYKAGQESTCCHYDSTYHKFRIGDRIKNDFREYTVYRISDCYYELFDDEVGAISMHMLFCDEDKYELVEQQPAEWSEEDEKQVRQIERLIETTGCCQTLQNKIHNWFKSVRLRFY